MKDLFYVITGNFKKDILLFDDYKKMIDYVENVLEWSDEKISQRCGIASQWNNQPYLLFSADIVYEEDEDCDY